MSTPARFNDGQYKNWLKCSQSLIIMKEALHDYVNNEVKKLHGDITQNVSSIPCGSSTGNQCGLCTWKNIKLSEVGNWFINCRICDKWLCKILDFHEDPHNPNINWKNADIRKWPSDCYQVAKIFMPKGQDKTTKMPEDLDTPAILSLMKYCNWFRKDLPSTEMLSDLINIRNKVLHSGDLRVTDGNKDQWIDKMIQFLSDLKMHVCGDVQAELQKLKREDVVINFQETEIRILQNLVSCLDSDLTTMKEDIVSVHNIQSQLSEEVKHLRDDTTEATRNVDILEADVEQMRKSLNELGNITDKVVTFFDKTPGILDTKVTETIQNIRTDVQGLLRNLSNVEMELVGIKARLTKQEEATEQLRKDVEELKGLKKRREQNENDELSLQKEFELLRAELLTRYKSLRTIPISPFDENEEVFTPNNFYTDLVIDYKDKERKRQEQNQSPVSYKHLFKGRERIILTGVAGSGKSTYCRKLVNRWYNLQKDKKIAAGIDGAGPSTHDSLDLTNLGTDDTSRVLEQSTSTHETSVEAEPLPDFLHVAGPTHDSSHVAELLTNDSSDVFEQLTNDSSDEADSWTDNSSDNGESSSTNSSSDIADEDLLKFDVLFYIYSPVISNETNLVELLCNQCIQRELKRDKAEIQEKVSKILSDHPEKILIIFDGLDEMEKPPDFLDELFRRCLYPRVTVLMGMRHWQISRLGLKATSHYDLLLDIQGFSLHNARKFVKKVIDLDNDMYGQKKCIDIYSHEEILLSFKNIPLLLLFLAHILYRNQSLPDKRRNLYDQILDCLIERRRTKSENTLFKRRKVEENMFREKYLNSAYKVAHHFLLTREGGISVVIPEKELIQELGDDADKKLSALLDCGIISKEDFFSPLEKNISVTFLHTSVQEYLASIHLVQNEDAFQSFLQSLETLNDVLRYENLFIFICGLHAGQGYKAFSRICQVCDVDPYVLNYRQGKDDVDDNGSSYFKVDDIESLNELYKACINEMDTHDPLEIPDIFACNDEWYKLIMSRQSSCYVKSLNLTWSEESHCVLDLSSLTYLMSLTLSCLSLSEEQSRSLCCSISWFTHLHKLELYYINLTDGVLDLSNLHDLTSLTLYSLKISEKLSRSLFRAISACTKLERLELYDITLHDGVLDLHTLTCLISIKLGHIIISEENRLHCFNISGIAQLDKLEKLDLIGMKLCMRQHNGVPEPSRLMRLKYIRMVRVTMCEKCSSPLCSIISGCGHLSSLEMDDVTLHDGTLDLKDLTNLTFLSLLQVSMSNGCSRFLRSSISNCICLKSLDLWYITLNDGTFDLNSLTQLTSLSLHSVNMSDECSRCLCLSISTGVFAHLKRLHLKRITLCGVINLTTMASLTDLLLARLTMSEECTKSLCNSILACTNLEILELHSISLHDTVLDLKKFRNLSLLKLFWVPMSSECRKVLNESKQHCPKLEHIQVIPHDLDTPS